MGVGLRDRTLLLVLDTLVFAAEAEVRWLDHVEARLIRDRGRVEASPTPVTDPATAVDTEPDPESDAVSEVAR